MSFLSVPGRLVVATLLAASALAAPAAAQLAIAVRANPGVAVPGEQLEIQVVVSNPSGVNVASSLTVVVPAGVDPFLRVAATGSPAGCTQIVNDQVCQNGESLIWNLGSVLAGQSTQVSLAPVVSASASGPIPFDASLSAGGAASATVSIDAGRTLELSLHEERDPIAAGDDLVYTLHFGNASELDSAPNALLSLPVPAATTFVSASGGGALNGATVEWALGALAPGQSGTRTATFAAGGGLARGTLVPATATLSDTSVPAQLARAREVTEIDGTGALELALALGPDPVAVGEQVELAFVVSNRGAAAIGSVFLALRWPEEIEPFLIFRGTGAPSGCTQVVNDVSCTAGEFVVWDFGSLAAGQSSQVTYALHLADFPDATLADFEAYAVVTGNDDRAAAGLAVAVDSGRALELSLHEERDPIAAGGDLVYTLHFGNASESNSAPGATLSLPVPEGASFVSASHGGSIAGGAVTWSLGTLQPGQSGTRTAVFAADAGLARAALLRARATLSDTSVPAQLARAREVTEIDGTGALELALALGPDPVAVGEQVELAFVVSNRGAAAIGSVFLALRWPEEIEPFLIFRGTGAPSGCTQVVNDLSCTAGEFVVWDFGSLAAGQSSQVTYALDLADFPDATLADFEAYAVVTGNDDRAAVGRALAVDSATPLRLGIQDATDPIAAGDDLVYTLHFGNPSASASAPAAELAFAVPEGASFLAASDGGSLVGDTVVWSLGTLLPGQSDTRTVTVTSDPGLGRGVLLRAAAELADTSTRPQLARASVTTEVDTLEVFELALAVTNPPGRAIAVALTVTNGDAVTRAAGQLALRMPRAMEPFNTASTGGAGCTQVVNDVLCQPGEFLVWNLGNLAAGQSVVLAVPAMVVTTPKGGIHQLHAWVANSSTDHRAAARFVPEPSLPAALAACLALLALLRGRRPW